MAKQSKGQNTPPGPGVDATGQSVVDPTENVKAILEAAVQRQDDLREQESRHVRELGDLRMTMNNELRHSESERIDAIRAVDVGNVQRTAEVQATQQLALATQVATSAEALRTQVATTAAAFDAKLSLALEPIQKRIDDLSRAQYEQQGIKANVAETREVGSGQRQSVGLWIAAATVVVTIVIAITGVVVALLVQNPTP